MHKVRLWIRAAKIFIIFPIVVAIAFVIVGIVIAITTNIFAGIFISVLFFIIFFLVFYLNSYIVEIDQSVIKEKSLLGKIKKQNSLENLKKVRVLTLYGERRGRAGYTSDYFVLYFSDREENFRYIDDALDEDDIIIFERTSQSETILEQYTNLPIEDKSELKDENRTKNRKGNQ